MLESEDDQQQECVHQLHLVTANKVILYYCLVLISFNEVILLFSSASIDLHCEYFDCYDCYDMKSDYCRRDGDVYTDGQTEV